MDGILLVDKPMEWTSMDVCAHLRGVLHERHIGHTGTLDPNATGLLVVLVGKATKLAKYLENDTKEYTAGIRLGVKTNTQDIWGDVVSETDIAVSREELDASLAQFRGDQMQIPPMYSAVKIRGKKLYEIARKGGEVAREPRKIHISRLELLDRNENGDWTLNIECSKGTYIRTLCSDIGDAVGCGACMSSLRRTRAGKYYLSDAHTLPEIREDPSGFMIPIEESVTGNG